MRRNDYDGINLDFENGAATDRDALTTYVERLGAALHAIGARLAVDVSPKYEHTTTGRSGLYDYEAIARAADTVFVMNWGWHWTTSDPGAPDDLEFCRRVADYVATMPNRSRFVLGTQMYGMDWPGGGGPGSPRSMLGRKGCPKGHPVSSAGVAVLLCEWPARRSGAAIRTLALTYVEMALVRADRLTATERAMASTVRGRPGRTHGGFS